MAALRLLVSAKLPCVTLLAVKRSVLAAGLSASVAVNCGVATSPSVKVKVLRVITGASLTAATPMLAVLLTTPPRPSLTL